MSRFRGVVIFVLLLTAAAGCGGSSASSDSHDTDHPASPGANSVVTAVKLTDSGCDPENFDLPAGSLVFKVTNSGTTKVKEMEIQNGGGRVMGDIEGVEPGQTKSFVVDLKAGTYSVKCPQDADHAGTLTVK